MVKATIVKVAGALVAAILLAGCVYDAPPPAYPAYYAPGYYAPGYYYPYGGYYSPPVYGGVYFHSGRWR